jgi:hypothetical protein
MKKLYVVPSNTKGSAQEHDKSESTPTLPAQVSVPAKVYAKVFQQTRILSFWVPEPTIATHMQKGCLSPKVDWSEHFNRIDETIFR